jgi:competence protein ComGC
MKLRNYKIAELQNPQRGYMLISLMLIFALMAVALLAVLPSVKQQLQRDREDELRHRGTMYMRAIQHFYQRNKRYPTSVEELEQSNHVRFLRRRYKDPMSWDPQAHKERDFKLLHMQDVMMGGMTPGGGLPGPGGGLPNPGGGQPSPGGGPPNPGGGQSGPGGGLQSLTATLSMSAMQGLGLGQSFGGCQGPSGGQSLSGGQGLGGTQTQNSNNNQNSDPSNPGNSNSDSSGSPNPNNPSSGTSNPSSPGGSPGPSGQTFGGGAILGVASTNKKDKAIHEYNKKTHYTDWCFIYDPSMDAYGLLVGPWQPITIGGGGIGQPIGAPATGQQSTGGFGQGQSGFGQSGFGQSGFGQSGSLGQSPNSNPQNPQPGGTPPNN